MFVNIPHFISNRNICMCTIFEQIFEKKQDAYVKKIPLIFVSCQPQMIHFFWTHFTDRSETHLKKNLLKLI